MYEDEIPVGYAKDLRGQKFNRLTVLYRTYNNTSHKGAIWKCQCDCGNTVNVRGDALQRGSTKSCGCYHDELSAKRMSKNLLGQRFERLTVLQKTKERDKNGNIVWLCQCDCGNFTKVPTSSLIKGNTRSCGCLQREKAALIGERCFIDLTGQRFGKLIALERAPSNHENARWKCLCDCGAETIVSSTHLRSGHTQSCGCSHSKGNEKIANLLTASQIPFQREYSFDTCRFKDTDKLARFDFYINEYYLIEYDGSQHFSYTGTGWDTKENFEKTQQRDIYKNQWCEENHVPLIRIPYTKLNTLCIEDLLLETTKFRIV